jgi:type II secretory pathway pseudopilin PulG
MKADPQSRRGNGRKGSAFTQIQLLIVIIVIGALVGWLLPPVAKAGVGARRRDKASALLPAVLSCGGRSRWPWRATPRCG